MTVLAMRVVMSVPVAHIKTMNAYKDLVCEAQCAGNYALRLKV